MLVWSKSTLKQPTFDSYVEIKTMMAMEAKRQRAKVSHVPSTINQNEDLDVHDVIFPRSLNLLLDLELTETNTKRTIVNSLGMNLRITLNDNEVRSTNDYNVIVVYRDMWLPKLELENNQNLDGINPNDGTIRALQVKASNYVGTDDE